MIDSHDSFCLGSFGVAIDQPHLDTLSSLDGVSTSSSSSTSILQSRSPEVKLECYHRGGNDGMAQTTAVLI